MGKKREREKGNVHRDEGKGSSRVDGVGSAGDRGGCGAGGGGSPRQEDEGGEHEEEGTDCEMVANHGKGGAVEGEE